MNQQILSLTDAAATIFSSLRTAPINGYGLERIATETGLDPEFAHYVLWHMGRDPDTDYRVCYDKGRDIYITLRHGPTEVDQTKEFFSSMR
jgi:hypothetical protein